MAKIHKFEGDLSSLWKLQTLPPISHLTWDWWWWLVMLDDDDGNPAGRQLMVLWSTKDNPLVEVNGHPWTPTGRPGFDDDGAIVLPHIYLIQPDGGTNQGTIDFTTGTIVLNSFRPLAITDTTTSIKLNVVPEINNSDITPLREQILTYDVTDLEAITINMVSETII